MSHISDDTAGADLRGNSPLEIDESAITIREKIGNGGFGVVYRGEWEQKNVALKFIKKEGNSKEAELLQREGSLLWRYKHDNIIVLHGVCRFSEKTTSEIAKDTHVPLMDTLFVMECAQGGSLEDVVKKYHADIQYDVRVDWATQIASGLKYLHDHDCVHRDLHSQNVLIMEYITSSRDLHRKTLKISDFGLVAEGFKETKKSTRRSYARDWMAPEIYNVERKFSKKSDVWSYGAVLYWIIYGRVPQLSTAGTPSFPEVCEPNFKNILIGCFKSNHRDRPEISNILKDLKDSSGQRVTKATVTQSLTSQWEAMDHRLLELKFHRNAYLLSKALTLRDVYQIASKLLEEKWLLLEEYEEVTTNQIPTQAARMIIDLIKKRNAKKIYCAVLKILQPTQGENDELKDFFSTPE